MCERHEKSGSSEEQPEKKNEKKSDDGKSGDTSGDESSTEESNGSPETSAPAPAPWTVGKKPISTGGPGSGTTGGSSPNITRVPTSSSSGAPTISSSGGMALADDDLMAAYQRDATNAGFSVNDHAMLPTSRWQIGAPLTSSSIIDVNEVRLRSDINAMNEELRAFQVHRADALAIDGADKVAAAQLDLANRLRDLMSRVQATWGTGDRTGYERGMRLGMALAYEAGMLQRSEEHVSLARFTVDTLASGAPDLRTVDNATALEKGWSTKGLSDKSLDISPAIKAAAKRFEAALKAIRDAAGSPQATQASLGELVDAGRNLQSLLSASLGESTSSSSSSSSSSIDEGVLATRAAMRQTVLRVAIVFAVLRGLFKS